MPSSYTPTGSSAPQLPAWTYTAGAIGAGLFTTDNPSAGGTDIIILSKTVAGAWSEGHPITPANGSNILLLNSVGAVSAFNITASSDSSDNIQLNVSALFSAGLWSGRYTAFFVPQLSSLADIEAAASITPVADGTYTVGLGVSTNGTITLAKGIITFIQEATP